ncbi:CPBP family intramembrane glutamic endopeptidase [Ornithinimicrobium avium]|uniref:CPBP family intramembrane metalloprotease n=1 Tax=Ornithinimicrobium avium TaxID=2283195 RepID=A0A345NPS1_9MICO|nr:CPBP family intramembrane glutamic endopeptidase [Ornithinimicrobium avium]AXH97029.1 CPBP family intramembrane metalloprotease [Ornithinimicrobium avium]
MGPVNPVTELRAFLNAALVTKVPRQRRDPPGVLRRRRIVSALTLGVGAVLLWWSLSLRPGDPLFYLGTAALALTWAAGALLAGPLHVGRARTRDGTSYAVPVVQSLALGALLVGVFLAGAFLVAQVPVLRGPVDDLLDHARYGSLPLVLVLTAGNGIAEEAFFRGALYSAIPERWTVAVTTAVYTLTTVVSGVPLLVLAAASLGLVCGLQRRVTGGVLGPVITHVTWSTGMLLLLPPILTFLR